MGDRVQLGSVRTWYDERGGGEPLVLHPGAVDSRTSNWPSYPAHPMGSASRRPTLCNTILVDFLTTDPVHTLARIRRRS